MIYRNSLPSSGTSGSSLSGSTSLPGATSLPASLPGLTRKPSTGWDTAATYNSLKHELQNHGKFFLQYFIRK